MDGKYVPGTIEVLEQKIQKLQENQARMKRVNAYYRKHKTLEGCPDTDAATAEKIHRRLTVFGGKPFTDQTLRCNLNSIKETQHRLRNQTALRDAGDGWAFNGGRIVIDRERMRVSLCDSSDEIQRRIKELGHIFYTKAPDGTPQMMFFDHMLVELLEMTRQYDELYPADSRIEIEAGKENEE